MLCQRAPHWVRLRVPRWTEPAGKFVTMTSRRALGMGLPSGTAQQTCGYGVCGFQFPQWARQTTFRSTVSDAKAALKHNGSSVGGWQAVPQQFKGSSKNQAQTLRPHLVCPSSLEIGICMRVSLRLFVGAPVLTVLLCERNSPRPGQCPGVLEEIVPMAAPRVWRQAVAKQIAAAGNFRTARKSSGQESHPEL